MRHFAPPDARQPGLASGHDQTASAARARLTPADVRLEDFRAVVEQTTDLAAYPHADRVEQNVLVYDADRLRTRRCIRGGPRRRSPPSWCGRSPTARGSSCSRARSPTTRCRPGDRGLRRDHRRGGGRRRRSRRPLRRAGREQPGLERAREARGTDPEAFVAYYANDVIALASSAWLGPAYQVTSQVNVVRPGRQGPGAAPRLPPRLPHRRGDRAVPDPRARAVAGADPPGRGRAHRHAAGERADALPALLAPVPPRLPRLAARRLQGVLRRAPRPAAAPQGRRRVLQPRAVPRRRVQRLGRHPADGEPAPGLLGVRPGDGAGGPGPGGRAPSTRRCGRAGSTPPAWRPRWPPPRRATRSRPTSTSTSRSTG